MDYFSKLNDRTYVLRGFRAVPKGTHPCPENSPTHPFFHLQSEIDDAVVSDTRIRVLVEENLS